MKILKLNTIHANKHGFPTVFDDAGKYWQLKKRAYRGLQSRARDYETTLSSMLSAIEDLGRWFLMVVRPYNQYFAFDYPAGLNEDWKLILMVPSFSSKFDGRKNCIYIGQTIGK